MARDLLTHLPENQYRNRVFDRDGNFLYVGDFIQSVQQGEIPGMKLMHGMGERINVNTTAAGEDVWRGNDLSATPAAPASTTSIPDPAAAGERMTFISESDADNGGTATGVLTIRIFYLDATGVEQTEDLTMNGTTAVNTVATNIRYVNDVCALTVGSGGVAAGNIRWFKFGANTIVYGMIAAGGNKSLVPHRMVPLGKKLYLKGWHTEEARGKRNNVRIRSTDVNGVLTAGVYCFKDSAFVNSSATGELVLTSVVPALSVVKVSSWAVTLGGDIGCSWWGVLVDD